jgi:hypothetical protein
MTKDIEASPGAWFSPGLQALFHDNSPAGIAGTPAAPIYDYHAVLDELAPIANDRAMMHRLCDAGVTVQHVETLGTEHDTEAYVHASDALDFLAARFAGTPATNTCATIPDAPAAPAPLTIPTAAPSACRGKRRVTLHIRTLRQVHVTRNGHRVAVHRRGKTTVKVGGRQAVTVRVVGHKHGKRVVRVHRYHGCSRAG